MNSIESEFIKQEAKSLINLNRSQSSSKVLPRGGWQDRKVYLKALMKAKAALEIIEIDYLMSDRNR